MTSPDRDDTPTIPATDRIYASPESSTRYQHYTLERRPDGTLWELGRGGMGVTYKATDVNLQSPVALKIIGPQCFGGENSRRRFIREARLAAQIRHPNVAAIYHLDSQGDEVFYSMEFVEGVTAHAWVKEHGPMSVELALDVAMQVTRALTAADRLLLVHRDIKPANIMLLPDPADSSRVIAKVIDFGLAQSLAAEVTPTLTTCGFAGTPQYSSPEQVENLDLDIRADIYSLGCTLWFLLTGEAPFVGSVARVIAQHLTSEPPWERLNHLPAPVIGLLRRMTSKEPAARPQNPVDLHAEICACRENARRPAPAPAFIARWSRLSTGLSGDPSRRRRAASAATLSLVALGAVFLAFPKADESRVAAETSVMRDPVPPPVAASPPVTAASEIPGIPPASAESPATPHAEDSPPQEPPAPYEPRFVNLTDFEPQPSSLDFTPLDSADAIDLRSRERVSLAINGVESLSKSDRAEGKSGGKTATRSTQRKKGTSERRSNSFKPVDNIRRGVQGLVNRLF